MSFAVSVKQELSRMQPERSCCRTAELAALFRAAGTFHIAGNRSYGLHAAFGLSATARSAVRLIRSFDMPVEIRVREEPRLGMNHRYELHLEGGERLVQFLNEIGVLSDDLLLSDRLPHRIISKPCCRVAFLRGAFMAAGSVSAPTSDAHLEIYSDNEQFLETVIDAAREADLTLTRSRRRKRPAAYCKNLQTIRDFLVAIGAHQGALELEERSVLSRVRGDANRLANFDEANARRCTSAAAVQVAAIEKLLSSGRLDRLSPALQEIAELRFEHRSDTLAELGRRANPPLTKSAMNHRLRRLVALAEQTSKRS